MEVRVIDSLVNRLVYVVHNWVGFSVDQGICDLMAMHTSGVGTLGDDAVTTFSELVKESMDVIVLHVRDSVEPSMIIGEVVVKSRRASLSLSSPHDMGKHLPPLISVRSQLDPCKPSGHVEWARAAINCSDAL